MDGSYCWQGWYDSLVFFWENYVVFLHSKQWKLRHNSAVPSLFHYVWASTEWNMHLLQELFVLQIVMDYSCFIIHLLDNCIERLLILFSFIHLVATSVGCRNFWCGRHHEGSLSYLFLINRNSIHICTVVFESSNLQYIPSVIFNHMSPKATFSINWHHYNFFFSFDLRHLKTSFLIKQNIFQSAFLIKPILLWVVGGGCFVKV